MRLEEVLAAAIGYARDGHPLLERASATLRNLSWFEVTDIRGAFEDGAVGWFQVTMKVGFRLDDA